MKPNGSLHMKNLISNLSCSKSVKSEVIENYKTAFDLIKYDLSSDLIY